MLFLTEDPKESARGQPVPTPTPPRAMFSHITEHTVGATST